MKNYHVVFCILFLVCFFISIVKGDAHEYLLVLSYCELIRWDLENIEEEVEELNEATKKTEEE